MSAPATPAKSAPATPAKDSPILAPVPEPPIDSWPVHVSPIDSWPVHVSSIAHPATGRPITASPAEDSPILAAAKLIADVDADGNNQLHRCTDPEVAKALLALGVRHDVRNRAGESPLHTACAAGRADVARVLLEHGADINCGDPSAAGRALLYAAIQNGHVGCVEVLLEAGADPNTNLPFGLSMLSAATAADRPKIVSLLIECGAHPNLARFSCTALDYALDLGHEECKKIIVEAGGTAHSRRPASIEWRQRAARIAAIGPAHAEIAELIVESQDSAQ